MLGAGGMGIVFEASNELTEKRVAIKVLQPHFAARPEHVQRMLREAQASARIRHPNVVDVFDVGSEGDTPFLVMEYLEGETLAAKLARGVLSTPEALALLVPAMRGVAAGHACGIIHRDVKPENIFLSRQADRQELVPKVLDFGISKVSSLSGEDLSLTASGTTLGTPLYMSYEQLSGLRDVDGRADVYAFGVILYEALTGRTPFRAETLGSLAVQIATTTPMLPSELRPGLRLGLDDVVMRAIARSRDARFGSLDALILALSPFTGEGGPVLGLDTLPAMASWSSSQGRAPASTDRSYAKPHVSTALRAVSARALRPRDSARMRLALWATSLLALALGYLLFRSTSSSAARDREAQHVGDPVELVEAPPSLRTPSAAIEPPGPPELRTTAAAENAEAPPSEESSPVASKRRPRAVKPAVRNDHPSAEVPSVLPPSGSAATQHQQQTPARNLPLHRAGKPSLDEF